MKKIKIWLPILCIVVVAVTFYMLHDAQNKVNQLQENEVGNETQNTLQSEDVIHENSVENANVQNEVINQVQNTVTNTANTTNPTNTTNTNKPISDAPAIPAVTDQKQKAIELVKKEWGTDNSVDFLFEYINENGEYVVSVKDKATATVKYYFRVNLETKAVELD